MNKLSGSKVLVIGGAGFIGSHICDMLVEEYDVGELIVVDNLYRGKLENIQQAMRSKRVFFLNKDIRHQEDIWYVFGRGIDYCFHLAALPLGDCAESPRQALDVMINGAYNVMYGCIHKVKKLVYASSASVYGQADLLPTPESHHPYHNQSFYGACKMAGELMLKSFYHMYELESVALRYFNVYGERMDARGKYTIVLVKWYQRIKEGKPPIIYGTGKQTMDMIHVRDVARATIEAMESEENGAYNVGSGFSVPLISLCLTMLKIMGSDLKPEFRPLPGERESVEVYSRRADTSKAAELLEFVPEIDLSEGLRRLVKWLDKNV